MSLIGSRPWYAEENSQRLVTIAFIAIAIIAMADAIVIPFIGLGYLYVIPLVVASTFLARWQIVVIAVICTAFSEGFSRLPDGGEQVARVVFTLLTFLFVSLLARELAVYARASRRRLNELEQDVAELHKSEQELELLINSTTVGILTVSKEGRIVSSNRAAHEIFSVDPGGLTGLPLTDFLPIPTTANSPAIECPGRNSKGQPFDARVWTSTFRRDDTEMTAVFIDASAARLASDHHS